MKRHHGKRAAAFIRTGFGLNGFPGCDCRMCWRLRRFSLTRFFLLVGSASIALAILIHYLQAK